MKRKGFTLVELLVVIAIIALLMSILMPALAQVRRLAQRIMCGTHLSAIGKAMLVYSQDNESDFPRSGGRLSEWGGQGKIYDWKAIASGTTPAQTMAFQGSTGADATITSCFFLLVKYSDGVPKIFNCAGDLGSYIFKLSDCTAGNVPEDIKDAWDFGDNTEGTYWPGEYVSYSYHLPFTWLDGDKRRCYALTSSDSSASPLCADRNPYLDKNANDYIDGANGEDERPLFDPDRDGFVDADKVRNSAAHQREGQNVLYVDGHVEFEKAPNCGIQNDLIWLPWDKEYDEIKMKDRQFRQANCRQVLHPGRIGTIFSRHIEDAFLVNEYNGNIQGWNN